MLVDIAGIPLWSKVWSGGAHGQPVGLMGMAAHRLPDAYLTHAVCSLAPKLPPNSHPRSLPPHPTLTPTYPPTFPTPDQQRHG